ncbi:hypothetical protein BvCmsNSNP030_3346 [Escherichia coli]|nr:hypothetical protein BvCmsNSNP030_1673 [Escherichia coli]BCM48327.1 hypothetical protein BvCmsNSNP030_3346 [Escherichia coli]
MTIQELALRYKLLPTSQMAPLAVYGFTQAQELNAAQLRQLCGATARNAT